jgi:hypothetical protein
MNETSSTAHTASKGPVDAPIAMRLALGFVAGFVAILAFEQSVLALLSAAGVVSTTAYSLAPAAVTGVPQLLSRACRGGAWGVAFALIERRLPRRPAYAFWVAALAFGALLPSLFAWFVVEPMKHLPPAAGGDPVRLGVALASNGAWGIGTAAVYRVLRALWSRRLP